MEYFVESLYLKDKNDVIELFDAEFYLATYPDIGPSGLDPFFHYQHHGWKENRKPAPWFDSSWYKKQYSLKEQNPFQHFCEQGISDGLTCSAKDESDLLKIAHTEFNKTYYLDTYKDIKKANLDPWNHFVNYGWKEDRNPNAWFNMAWYKKNYFKDRKIERNVFLHYLLIGRKKNYKPSIQHIHPMSASLEEDFIYTINSLKKQHTDSIEDFHYYKTYLNKNKYFDEKFYSSVYRGEFSTEPLRHYIIEGRQNGFYGNAFHLIHHANLIDAFGNFDKNILKQTNTRNEYATDDTLNFLLTEQRININPNNGFNINFFKAIYKNFAGLSFSPYPFYIENQNRTWVYKNYHELIYFSSKIRKSKIFDAECYASTYLPNQPTIDSAEHYAIFGLAERLECSDLFETDFYYSNYPDLERNKVNPLLHFEEHGIKEGRAALPSPIEDLGLSKKLFNEKLDTIVLFSHEASRTGAPIVALNLAQTLANKYNVYSWLGKDGVLSNEFAKTSIEVSIGFGSFTTMSQKLDEIKKKYSIHAAIVNSVVCHPIIRPLKNSRIPIVSLIHEFADYVYPEGSLSRMAVLSDITVFPAKVVKNAYMDELERINYYNNQKNIRIRNQGYNFTKDTSANIDTDSIYELIGESRENHNLRIVFGAGWVQPRKGVDLFLQIAQQAIKDTRYTWKFIWVGGNYSPKTDMIISVYLQAQIEKSNLSNTIFMIDEQPNLDAFWEVSDIFLLSSRLDPFPNVCIDALYNNIPVVCFDQGTGVAELQEQYPQVIYPVGFSDIMAAAETISNIAGNLEAIKNFFESAAGLSMKKDFSFEHYAEKIEEYIVEARSINEKIDMAQHIFQNYPDDIIQDMTSKLPKDISQDYCYNNELRRTLASLIYAKDGFTENDLDSSLYCDYSYASLTSHEDTSNILHVHMDYTEDTYKLLTNFIKRHPNLKLVITLEKIDLKTIYPNEVISTAYFTQGIDALSYVIKNYSTEYISFCDLSLLHLRMIAAPSSLHWNFLSSIVSNMPINFLKTHQQNHCVIIDSKYNTASTFLTSYVKNKLNISIPKSFPNNLMGTYKKEFLINFILLELEDIKKLSAGLDKQSKAKFTSIALNLYHNKRYNSPMPICQTH